MHTGGWWDRGGDAVSVGTGLGRGADGSWVRRQTRFFSSGSLVFFSAGAGGQTSGFWGGNARGGRAVSPGSDEIGPGWEAHLRHRGGPALDGAITPRVGVGRGLSHVSLLSENSSKRRSARRNPRPPPRASLRPCESTSAPTARAIRRPSRAVEFTPSRVDDPSERRGPPSHYAPTARASHTPLPPSVHNTSMKKKLRLWCRACAGRRWYRAPCIDAGFARASLLTPVYVHEGTQGPVAWRPVAMEPCRFATVVPSQTCNRGAVPVRRIADLLNRFFFSSESARNLAIKPYGQIVT